MVVYIEMDSEMSLHCIQTVERHLPVVGVGRGNGGRGITNIKDDDEKREYFDSEKEFNSKLDKVAKC